ncbi:hypothetical protein RvY_00502 [Ramazzottius varieornatus]|uniref:Uncharacterized protein n=1 Tax=Ramazzottius varieornatus TaxID=947166 RepID=A0A1D1UD04_RAMVA|nr:hypothetical protein RvY_00502 [Ramazzottius varieornatus]
MCSLTSATDQTAAKPFPTADYPDQLNPFGSDQSLYGNSEDSLSYDEGKNPFWEEPGYDEPTNMGDGLGQSIPKSPSPQSAKAFRPTPAPRRKFGSVRVASTFDSTPSPGLSRKDRRGSLEASSPQRPNHETLSGKTVKEGERCEHSGRTAKGTSRRPAPRPPKIVLVPPDEDGNTASPNLQSDIDTLPRSITPTPSSPRRSPLNLQERTKKDHEVLRSAFLTIKGPSEATPNSSPKILNTHSPKSSPASSVTASQLLPRKGSGGSGSSSGRSPNPVKRSLSSLLFDAGTSFRYF